MSAVDRAEQISSAEARPVTSTARELKDAARGYLINRLYVAIAYVGELVLIATSLVGAWLFAVKYGHNDHATMAMMMLAPVSYAVVELCRVPLAIAFRTQSKLMLRLILAVGVLLAAAVSVKSLAQLGEQMFHPRLVDVVNANERLRLIEREKESFEKQADEADRLVEQRTVELRNLDQRSISTAAQMAGIKEQRCVTVRGVDRQGRPYTAARCPERDPRAGIIQGELERLAAERDVATKRHDEATAARGRLSRQDVDRRESEAKTSYREAVLNSQLHSFTAMFYGKNPTDVADAEIHLFLRYFVFFPAVFASLASTLLALGAVQRIPPRPVVALPDHAGAYVLGGFAEHIIREATEAVHREAVAEVRDAAARVGGPIKVVA